MGCHHPILSTEKPLPYVLDMARNNAFAEESAEVEVLFAEAQKVDGISKRIRASLGRLETGGQTVKDAMGPIYSNTQDLQVMNGNIDKILAAIDRMLAPSEDKDREEKIIRAGPDKVGISDYLSSMKRVDRALSQMNATNLRVNQQAVGDLNSLLSDGSERLLRIFHSILADNLRPVEPLHFITKQLPFPGIEESKVQPLKAIAALLSSPSIQALSRDGSATRTYSDVRGSYIRDSLQNLATASRTPAKKRDPSEVYKQGSSGVGTYANGIEGILLREHHIIKNVFPQSEWIPVFDATCRKALSEFAKTLRELSQYIKSNMFTDCFLAYEIIDIGTRLAYELTQKTDGLKQYFLDALRPIRDVAKSSLPELIDDVRRRISAIMQLPGDGSVLPLTSEVMTRLQNLTLYPKPVGSILTSLGDGNWKGGGSTTNSSSTSLPSLKSFDVGADGGQLLAHYVLDTIETLLTGFDGKARLLHKSKALHGIFIANTVALIDRMIRSSDLSMVLSSSNAATKVETWRKKGTSAYLESWREPSAALMDVTSSRSARPPSGSNGVIDSAAFIKALGSKDKDAIKEKFKTFNASFDDLCAKHNQMKMEREVKNQLAREVQAVIEPLYARFWDRYHEVDKGKGKYVKYDKGSLSAALAQLS